MCTPNRPTPSPSRAGPQQAGKSFARRFALTNPDGSNNKTRMYLFAAAVGGMFLMLHILATNDASNNNNDTSSSFLRFSRTKEEPLTNRFSYSTINSPYEQIWVNSHLEGWAKKKKAFQAVESKISPEERICYVHVGKAGGSSVGCSLGFSLHCNNDTQKPLGGLLPQRTTRIFHADTYDCHDDSAYFLFVIRNPVERIKSAFLYDRPASEKSLKRHFVSK